MDSLLHAYEKCQDAQAPHQQTVIGRQLMAVYKHGAIFFDDVLATTDDMSVDEKDLIVWFGTERFYTTNSYYTDLRRQPLYKKFPQCVRRCPRRLHEKPSKQ